MDNNKGRRGRPQGRPQKAVQSSGETPNKRQAKRAKSDADNNLILRLVFVLVVMVLCIAFVGIGKVWYIKVKHGTEYEKMAVKNQMNHIRDEIVVANKGNILDRNQQPLVVSNTVYKVIMDIRILNDQKPEVIEETIKKVSAILEIPEDDLRKYLSKDENGNLIYDKNYQVIARKVEYQKGKEIEDLGYNWIYNETDTKRTYLNKYLAAQVLGFAGLESYYAAEMEGTPGRSFRTFEEDGNVVTQIQSPIQGNTLITTLDQTIQQYADDACKAAYTSYKSNYTATIVMNPMTGEVYAMAQYPSFEAADNTKITELETNPELKANWDKLTDDEKEAYNNKAWRNFAINWPYEPGSIYKPIVVAMALEEGIITPSSTFVCGGYKMVPGWSKPIHCHKKSGHGQLDVQGVLANSCNVGMMDIIEKMTPEQYYKYHLDFGFHQPTGIDLPNEASASGANYQYDPAKMTKVDMAISSFGQGFSCTALQALNAFSATINGGKLMRPYVVSQIVNAKGEVVKERSPEVVRQVISQETSDYLRKAMQAVLSSEGTGKKAVIKGYAMGGKTGTAEQGTRNKKDYTLSFISYLSVDNPEIIVMTVIDRPENYYDGCGISPVPMLREVMEKIISYKAIAPSENADQVDIDVEAGTAQLKDYKGQSLKNTIAELVSMGLDFELLSAEGDTVTSQHPEAGTPMEKGDKVMLNAEVKAPDTLKEVPELKGKTAEDAKAILEGVGLGCNIYDTRTPVEEAPAAPPNGEQQTEETTEKPPEESRNKLVVFEQSPSVGKKVEAGTIVQIKVK